MSDEEAPEPRDPECARRRENCLAALWHKTSFNVEVATFCVSVAVSFAVLLFAIICLATADHDENERLFYFSTVSGIVGVWLPQPVIHAKSLRRLRQERQLRNDEE